MNNIYFSLEVKFDRVNLKVHSGFPKPSKIECLAT